MTTQPIDPDAGLRPYVAPRPTSGLAVAALICGVFGFLTCGLTAPLALVFGIVAMRQTSDGSRPGHGQAWAGVILGGVIVVIWALLAVPGLLWTPGQ